jgi:hypothetical protein
VSLLETFLLPGLCLHDLLRGTLPAGVKKTHNEVLRAGPNKEQTLMVFEMYSPSLHSSSCYYSMIVSTYSRTEHLHHFLGRTANGQLPNLDAVFIAWVSRSNQDRTQLARGHF